MLNVDGEVLMGNGEALKGDEGVLKGGREVSKSDNNTLNEWVKGNELKGDAPSAKGQRTGVKGQS